MIVTTVNSIPGRSISHVHGLVRGTTVRSRHLGKDIMALLKLVVGGEVHEYTKLVAEAREEALDRMQAEAHAMGANGVLPPITSPYPVDYTMIFLSLSSPLLTLYWMFYLPKTPRFLYVFAHQTLF